MNSVTCSDGCVQLSSTISKKRLLSGSGGYYNPAGGHVEYDPLTTHIHVKGALPISVGTMQKVVVLRNDKVTYMPASKLVPGDMVGFPIHKGANLPEWDKDDIVKKNLDNPTLWWIAGRYVADGWTLKDRRTCIAVATTKTEDIERMTSLGGAHVADMHSCKVVAYRYKDFHEFFKQMFGTGARNKYISEDVLCLPKELLRAFVEGYLRGDGYYHPVHKDYDVKTVSKSLALDLVRAIAKAYDRPAYVYETANSPKCTIKGKTCKRSLYTYRVSFSPEKRQREIPFIKDGIMWYRVERVVTPTEFLKGPRVEFLSFGATFVCNNVILMG